MFLLEKACCLNDSLCIAGGLPAVLANVAANLATILGDLRGTGFKGPIIVVNYYSTDYADANETGIVELLNEALATAAAMEGVVVADVFTASNFGFGRGRTYLQCGAAQCIATE